MAVKIVSSADTKKPNGVARYWANLREGIAQNDLQIDLVTLAEWKAKKVVADPASDLIIVEHKDALAIDKPFAVIAVQSGCAMEYCLRMGEDDQREPAVAQFSARARKRTFWVACSDWAAHYCRRHTGVQADRIIRAGVDMSLFYPARRQMKRDASKPVVLHNCANLNQGRNIIGQVAEQLSDAFEVRRLSCDAAKVADAMREADIWLSLSTTAGMSMAVYEALASNLVVVGTSAGALWRGMANAKAIHSRHAGLVAWRDDEIGAMIFDWQWLHRPNYIADWVNAAWHYRAHLKGRDYALKWHGLGLFAQKWLEAIEVASKQFKLTAHKAKATGKPRPKPKAKPVAKLHSEHGVRG